MFELLTKVLIQHDQLTNTEDVSVAGCLDSLVVYAPSWHAVDLRSIPVRLPLGFFQLQCFRRRYNR